MTSTGGSDETMTTCKGTGVNRPSLLGAVVAIALVILPAPPAAQEGKKLKVAGTVIRNILRSGSAAAKLKAILRVGEVTGVGVVAECVEDEKVLAALTQQKVGYAQGFGIHKPEPIDDLCKS